MHKITLRLLTLILFSFLLFAQEPEAGSAYPQPTDLITNPTAGLIPRGAYLVDFRLFRNGGITASIKAGISTRFMFGISYGAGRLIGDDNILWNGQPAVEAKFRFVDESKMMPALLLGFNNQGQGEWDKTLKRYDTKAKGFYVVASKNFNLLGNFGLHAGINYNPMENKDGDRDPSFFLGTDKDLGKEITVMVEYDAALNDTKLNQIGIGEGLGILNCGIRWRLVENFHVEIDFNNILLSGQNIDYFTREFKLTFVDFF